MPKKEKTVSKQKHYFALPIKIHNAFEKYVKDNAISKPKLFENMVSEYLLKNNVKIDD